MGGVGGNKPLWQGVIIHSSQGHVGARSSYGRGIKLGCHTWPCAVQASGAFRSSTCTAAGVWGILDKRLSSPFCSGLERQLCYPLGGWGWAIWSIIFLTQILPLREHYGYCLQPTLVSDHVTSPSPLALSHPPCWEALQGRRRANTTCRLFFSLLICALLSWCVLKQGWEDIYIFHISENYQDLKIPFSSAVTMNLLHWQ